MPNKTLTPRQAKLKALLDAGCKPAQIAGELFDHHLRLVDPALPMSPLDAIEYRREYDLASHAGKVAGKPTSDLASQPPPLSAAAGWQAPTPSEPAVKRKMPKEEG